MEIDYAEGLPMEINAKWTPTCRKCCAVFYITATQKEQETQKLKNMEKEILVHMLPLK